MISLAQALDVLRRLSPELAARHIARIGVFGSLARGEAKPGSDIDVLVELTAEGDLFDLRCRPRRRPEARCARRDPPASAVCRVTTRRACDTAGVVAPRVASVC